MTFPGQTGSGGYVKQLIQDAAFPHPQEPSLLARSLSEDIGRNSGVDSPRVSKTVDYLYNEHGFVTGILDARGVAYCGARQVTFRFDVAKQG